MLSAGLHTFLRTTVLGEATLSSSEPSVLCCRLCTLSDGALRRGQQTKECN